MTLRELSISLCYRHIVSMLSFLHMVISVLLEGSRELLKLNSVLSAVKPFAALLLKGYFLVTNALWAKMRVTETSLVSADSQLALVLFGDCVPSKTQIDRAKWLKELRKDKDVHSVKVLLKKYKEIGLSVADLKVGGWTAAELMIDFKLEELKHADFTVEELKIAGFEPQELHDVSFTASELRAAFNWYDLITAGLPTTKLKEAGCSAAEMKDANKTAGELCFAFSIKELKAAGFDIFDLKSTGSFTAKDMIDAGFKATEIVQAVQAGADFSIDELMTARFNLSTLRDAGFPAGKLKDFFQLSDLHKAGFELSELKAAQFPVSELRNFFDLKQLHEEGITTLELKAAGFTAPELKAIGEDADGLRAAGFNASELKVAGFTAAQLSIAGFKAASLQNASFSATKMREAMFSATDLRTHGASYSVSELKRANYSLKELIDAKASLADLKEARFSAQELYDGGFKMPQLLSVGFSAHVLLEFGIASAIQLREAGATAKDLKQAGPRTLKTAGFPINELQGVFNVRELKEAMSVMELKETFSMTDLNNGGFTLDDFLGAGYEIQDFREEKVGNKFTWTAFALRIALQQNSTPLSDWPWICPKASDGYHYFWLFGNICRGCGKREGKVCLPQCQHCPCVCPHASSLSVWALMWCALR